MWFKNHRSKAWHLIREGDQAHCSAIKNSTAETKDEPAEKQKCPICVKNQNG